MGVERMLPTPRERSRKLNIVVASEGSSSAYELGFSERNLQRKKAGIRTSDRTHEPVPHARPATCGAPVCDAVRKDACQRAGEHTPEDKRREGGEQERNDGERPDVVPVGEVAHEEAREDGRGVHEGEGERGLCGGEAQVRGKCCHTSSTHEDI